jgi:sRNA-binding regulator protein Hfq
MGSKGVGKKKAPETTHRETEYLRELIDRKQTIRLRLMDNQEHTGTLEYFDATFVRLTRASQPNMFVYKHDIKYLFEV